MAARLDDSLSKTLAGRPARAGSTRKAAIKSRGTIAHVMQEKADAAMAYILFRGEYDKRRDQ